jgi:hypothetical protein
MRARQSLVVLSLVLVGCHAAPARSRAEPAPSVLHEETLLLVPHDSLEPGTLRGLLVPEHPGYPTRDVAVAVVGAGRTRADAAGAFELRGLTPGAHRLRVRAVGFRPLDAAVAMPASGAVVRITLALPRHCLDACTGPTRQPESRIAAVP